MTSDHAEVADELSNPGDIDIEALDAEGYREVIPALARPLVDAVEGGASVNFLADVELPGR